MSSTPASDTPNPRAALPAEFAPERAAPETHRTQVLPYKVTVQKILPGSAMHWISFALTGALFTVIVVTAVAAALTE